MKIVHMKLKDNGIEFPIDRLLPHQWGRLLKLLASVFEYQFNFTNNIYIDMVFFETTANQGRFLQDISLQLSHNPTYPIAYSTLYEVNRPWLIHKSLTDDRIEQLVNNLRFIS